MEDLLEIPPPTPNEDMMDMVDNHIDLSFGISQLDNPLYNHGDDEDLIDVSLMDQALCNYFEEQDYD